MTENSEKPYLGDPENLLTPEEMKALISEAEDIRTEIDDPGLGFPPENG